MSWFAVERGVAIITALVILNCAVFFVGGLPDRP